jgi:hypothetical protein
MKRGKQRRSTSFSAAPPKPAPVTDRRIVALHDGPLRQRAATACQREMAKLDEARAEWRRFEQEERPAFARWMAAHFGPLLTDLRENARLITERESLIEEVELEMIFSNHRNPSRAFAAVQKRRENSESADGFPEADVGPGGGEDGADAGAEARTEFSAEERTAIFMDFIRSTVGLDPQQMDKAQYAEAFADFEATMFGEGAPGDASGFLDVETPLARGEEARIKEIYRTLVRRLHPDLRADGDAAVSLIWHEVQEAYEARNLERLETLLALTEVHGGASGGQASLSQMRAALADLRRAFRAIRRSINSAKRDPAWGFRQRGDRAPLERTIGGELKESLRQQRGILADLQSTLDGWSRPWAAQARKPKKQRGPAQAELFAF